MPDLAERLPQALSGRFRIERELGRGGMATVFLAEDLRHHRQVAIKVLDPALAGTIGAERFLREIDTVARLIHPHILPLHDSGAAGDLFWYVMPFVEGESLRHRLAREGPLPVDDAVRITCEVADALECAHASGVVHRDIKPENVLLAAGHAMVADFGIARALGAAQPEQLTTLGVTLGTPAYMSPEQAAGSPMLDGRSDQYSLACMLYEMLAGVPPFVAPSAQNLLHQHLNVAPRSVAELRPSVPRRVALALARALAKVPADRFRSAGEFAAAVSAEAPGASLPPRPGHAAPDPASLATTVAVPAAAARHRPRALVLALGLAVVAIAAVVAWQRWGMRPAAQAAPRAWILAADFEGPPEDPGLARASRDLLCAALDQSNAVATVPRDQVRVALRAAGKPDTARVDAELGRELAYRSAVRAVLDGRIARLGSAYTVVVHLVDADSARTLITETATAPSEDGLIPALTGLAQRLRARLGEQRGALAATRPRAIVATPSFEAYRLYLRGVDKGRVGDNVQALGFYRAALAIDPDFATAWGALRFPYWNLGRMDSVVLVCDEALRRTNRLTPGERRSIENDRRAASGDERGAMEVVDRALIENPDDFWALNTGNDLLWDLGRFEDALARARKRMALRPFGPVGGDFINEAGSLMYLGRFAEARQVARITPAPWGAWILGQTELASGNYAAAESIALAMGNDPHHRLENVGGPTLLFGNARAARGALATADSCFAEAEEQTESRGVYADRFVRRHRLACLTLCLGQPLRLTARVQRDTTAGALIARGLEAACAGRSAVARMCLDRARARPGRERTRIGAMPSLLEAIIAGDRGRWDEVVRLLEPIALERVAPGWSDQDEMSWVRWVLADAYENLGRPDSAAAQLERVTTDPMSRVMRPYANLRLVPLDVRLGKGEEARRHRGWARQALTLPDPVVQRRIELADAALSRLR